MTQLIAVLREDKEKIVLMSDRMVSTGDRSLAFEHESKHAYMTPLSMVLTAGTMARTTYWAGIPHGAEKEILINQIWPECLLPQKVDLLSRQ